MSNLGAEAYHQALEGLRADSHDAFGVLVTDGTMIVTVIMARLGKEKVVLKEGGDATG